jgi:small ligand-binding sensory domain FIST
MVDLALLFTTGDFQDELAAIVDRVERTFTNAIIIGCTAEGTIGVDQELERVPSITLWAASMPDVSVRPYHIRLEDLEKATTLDRWERLLGVSPESKPLFVALGDPFRIPIHTFIDRINEFYPGAPIVGGVASAGRKPQENRLIIRGELVREGIVGVALSGDALMVDTVVSQGCRPIGKPFVITKAERNVIHDLGGRPALEQLHQVVTSLSGEDEKLVRQSLFVGNVINEYKSLFTRGDFLIYNIIGADRNRGSIAIAGLARVGTTIQFHVRDAASADEDLRMMLAPYSGKRIHGALLFGCNGRGTHMWPEPGHDVSVLREILGEVPVAGFFCGGEFGPIGGKNFVHGFTASIALFREKEPETS